MADDRLLLRGDERIPMSPRIFELLLALVENAGRLVTKETLMNRIWEDSFVEEGNLNQTVSRLRKILGERASDKRFIETVPRVGYRFIADVELVTAEPRQLAIAAAVGQDRIVEQTIDRPVERFAARPAHRRRWFFALPLVLVAAGAVALTWYLLPSPPAASGSTIPKQAPIRLTINPTREDVPSFTRNGEIRFLRWEGDQPRPYIMAGDGSNQRPETSVPNLKTGSWSPDGKRVVFSKIGDDKGTLYMANADGTDEVRLPFPAGNLQWSGDGSKIVYQYVGTTSDIYLYSVTTGESTELVVSPAFDSDPAFSPDGERVVFISDRDGNPEIYIQHLDGSNLTRLTNHPAHDEFPTFSPDGTQVVFNSDREDENFDIYIINTDGGGLRRLTNWRSTEEIRPGCWSADGTQLTLLSNRDGKPNVYRMDVEPFSPKPVLSVNDANLTSPSYSPDGKKLLYVSEAADKTAKVRVRDLDTQKDEVVTQLEDADAHPKFSPDGSRILFQSRINGNAEICVSNLDGSGMINLTNNPARDVQPAWSPDGSKIVFVSNRDGNYGVFAIYTMNADGSNAHRIYYTHSISHFPAWSPDGGVIVFTNDKEDGRTGNFEIFAIEPETVERERRLTIRPRADTHPAFSPDGKRIAFVSYSDGNYEIYVMHADGSGLLRITRDPAQDLSPAWSTDGNRLVFSSDRTGSFGLYEIALD